MFFTVSVAKSGFNAVSMSRNRLAVRETVFQTLNRIHSGHQKSIVAKAGVSVIIVTKKQYLTMFATLSKFYSPVFLSYK